MTIYQQEGYRNRRHYLQGLSENYNVPITAVWAIAGMLGPSEDFDGLVNALEDAEGWEWYA